MDLRILIFTVSTIFPHRGLSRPYKTFNFVVLLCAFFCIAAYGLCSTNGMQNSPEYDACASSGENCDSGFSNTVVGGTSLGCQSPPIHNSFENVCPDTHSFCFPSTLSGYNHKEKSLKAASLGDSGSQCDGPLCVGLAQDGKVTSNRSFSSDYGIFKLLNGGVASCSLNSRDGVDDAPSHQTKGCKNDIPFCGDSLHKQKTTHSWSKNSEMSKSSSFDGSFTPNVGIIYCNHLHTNLHDMSAEVSILLENCKLVILINDTTSPHVEIPCEDTLNICFEHQRLSFVGIKDKSKFGNMRAAYAVRSMRLPPNVKVTETADVDELVLGNWVSQGTTNDMSVVEDHEVLFPMVQVGSYVSRWISVKNPSHHPVMMQLILNSGEIIDECRGRDDNLHHFSSGNLVIDEAISRAKYGFSVPESAVTEAYVHPYDYATLGPIIFYPSKRCGWNGSALIRNNLSGVEWIPLRGFGGLLSLVILERSEHVQSINFDLKMHNLNFSLPHALLHMKEMTYACSQPLVKELYAKNTGDLPLEVKTMRVSGRECGLDGFKIHDCRGFSLQPGESIKLLISYQTDFSAAVVHRDLELALASGIFLIPMKASVPFDVLWNCKKCMFWMRVKKWFLGFLLVASLISLVFCFISPQTITLGSLDYLCKNEDNSIHITLNCAGKTPLLPCNQRKGKLSVSGKMNNLFCSVGKGTTSTMRATCVRYSYNLSEHPDKEISQHLMQASENHNEGKLPSTAVQGSDVMETSQLSKLVIKNGKEKGSRRRKKKSPGAKLTALSEFSSTRSRSSTPSSPLSPVAPASTKCSWPLAPDVEQPPLQAHSLTTQKAAKHPEKKCQASASTAKPYILEQGVPVKCCSNNISSPKVSHSASTSATSIPVKIPCATSPIPGGSSPSFLVSTSSVTLSARAPGSKLDKQRTVIAPKAGLADEYTYDIWGDHLSGLHLLVPKNVTCMKSSPAENNFDSFFVGGPQAIK